MAGDFTPAKPHPVWTADITDIWTHEGRLYLAVACALFHREVVGGSIHPRMTADMVMNALTMAWFRKKPELGLIHHSDRGSPYAGHAFQARLEAYGMVCSMSRKGTRYSTRAIAEADLFDDIESFYNRRRQHSTLSYTSPMKFLEGMSRNWRHHANGLDDEKQREAHYRPQCNAIPVLGMPSVFDREKTDFSSTAPFFVLAHSCIKPSWKLMKRAQKQQQ